MYVHVYLCVSAKDKALFYRSCQPENYFYVFKQMNLYKNNVVEQRGKV